MFQGETALMYACRTGNLMIVKSLVEHNSKIEEKDRVILF